MLGQDLLIGLQITHASPHGVSHKLSDREEEERDEWAVEPGGRKSLRQIVN